MICFFLSFFFSFLFHLVLLTLCFFFLFSDWTGWKGVMVIGERGIPMGNDTTTTTDAKEKKNANQTERKA